MLDVDRGGRAAADRRRARRARADRAARGGDPVRRRRHPRAPDLDLRRRLDPPAVVERPTRSRASAPEADEDRPRRRSAGPAGTSGCGREHAPAPCPRRAPRPRSLVERDHDEDRAEHGELAARRAFGGSTNCGRNARKKSAVFGLRTLHDDALAVGRARCVGSARRPPMRSSRRRQRADPEPDEVHRAGELHDRERRRRRRPGAPTARSRRPATWTSAPARDAERRRRRPARRPPCDALRDDVEHRRAGDDGERERRDREHARACPVGITGSAPRRAAGPRASGTGRRCSIVGACGAISSARPPVATTRRVGRAELAADRARRSRPPGRRSRRRARTGGRDRRLPDHARRRRRSRP